MTFLKYLINQFKSFVLALIVVLIYLPYTFSLRIIFFRTKKIVKLRQEHKNVIFAHFHQDELLLVGSYVFRGLHVLSSLSKDGSIMAFTLRLLGFHVHRGSSSRGGARGLLGLIKALQSKADVSLAIDGPRGPIYKVKPGVIELAAKTGAAIVPVGVAHGSAYVFKKSWNKCYLVKPFTKSVVLLGNPIFVEENIDHIKRSEYCDLLEKRLNIVRKFAYKYSLKSCW